VVIRVTVPDIHPYTFKLIQLMTGPVPSHRRFTGEPVELTKLDALALGDLWATAKEIARIYQRPGESVAIDTANAILSRCEEVEPAFRGSACRDYLEALASENEDKAGKEPETAFGIQDRFVWEAACFVLSRCIDLSFDGLAPTARRFLASADWKAMPHLAIAMARLVNADYTKETLEKLANDFADSPLFVAELRTAASLDLPANITVADAYPDLGRAKTDGEAHHQLSDYPGYVGFAETGLKDAVERLRKIYASELPYASDKAFTLKESEVIARLARVALDRDETWLPPVLDELLHKVSLAPTAAKSVPSQSVAINLGHAVEAFPTPEAVETLRQVLRDIRHAGVEKKLQRNLRGAERGLANRPEIALRLPFDQALSKSQLTTLSRCLEAGLALRMVLDYEDWRIRLAEHPQAKALAGKLVWRILDASDESVSVLPAVECGGLTLRDASGVAISAKPDSRVTLWHPLDATDGEQRIWRDRLAALRIKQPFKQIFREYYVVPSDELSTTATEMFSGHIVAIIPFLGLARRERWNLEYDCLARSFGQWTARFDLADHIYPGCEGATTTQNVSLWASSKRPSPACLGSLDPITLSEILRAIDLLVSASAFALSGDDRMRHYEDRLQHLGQGPLGAMAEMRKQALEHAFKGLEGMDDVQFDARHLRVDRYAIHLATGRVTCDGEPIAIDVPKPKLAAVPWLPHDEKLLETIFYTAAELARRHPLPATQL
jgi:hypothetical protein